MEGVRFLFIFFFFVRMDRTWEWLGKCRAEQCMHCVWTDSRPGYLKFYSYVSLTCLQFGCDIGSGFGVLDLQCFFVFMPFFVGLLWLPLLLSFYLDDNDLNE